MIEVATTLPGLAGRPVVDGSPLPFACEAEDGGSRHDLILKRRAIQCALSRVCGVCGLPQSRPLAFLGTAEEVQEGVFAFPPCHEDCAREAVAELGSLGPGYLGRADAADTWDVVTTAGFDLIRPARRGEPVLFRPNSVLAD